MSVSTAQAATAAARSVARPTWSVDAVAELFDLPFPDLLYRAQTVHREHHDPHAVQLSTLLSVKTGGCSEDCGYCSQAARYNTGLERESLLAPEEVLEAARTAKENGATRFCMGAAWKGPKQKDLDGVMDMIRGVKAMGLETCATLGMLKEGQAEQLREAGLDYYNHNLDTAPEFYGQVVSTHTQRERIDTIERVRATGMKVCSGGIIGMGETRRMRAGLIAQLASLDPYPDSVPINNLVPIEGTPMANAQPVDELEFVRTIAVARIVMPEAAVRLSAGRHALSELGQAMCFMAGANSIFYGDRLLTTGNPEGNRDRELLAKLGMYPAAA